MTGYLLMLLGGAAVLSAFLFRNPIFLYVNRHRVELWLLVLIAGLISFSVGALSVFRSVN
jgi:hypothetical protein